MPTPGAHQAEGVPVAAQLGVAGQFGSGQGDLAAQDLEALAAGEAVVAEIQLEADILAVDPALQVESPRHRRRAQRDGGEEQE